MEQMPHGDPRMEPAQHPGMAGEPQLGGIPEPQLGGEGAPGSAGGAGEARDRDQDAGRMVYVGNLPFSVKWQELKDHMGQAGTVEFARILTEDGTDWGRSRGSGYVRYSSEAEAQQAIATLKSSSLGGREIQCDAWTGSSGKGGGKGWGKGGWGKGGWGKGFGKGQDPWAMAMAMNGGWGKGGMPFFGKGFGKATQVSGDPNKLCYVGNLSYQVSWRDLKDHMSQAGTVEFAKVLTEDGTDYGRSRGVGCVRFAEEAQVQQAIATLAETELKGRKILVDHWSKGTPA